jgi:2-methylisocitrate lyase-like PEP mutase family enzyme
MINQMEKAQTFQHLHSAGTFIMPNFWDPGSALMLQRLGFEALASTSAGFAQTLGRTDGHVSLDEMLAHCTQVAGITSAPVSADFENGFADDPQSTAENVLRVAATGVVGASIEDFSGTSIYDHGLAVERIAACAEAVATLDFPFTLTARSENLIRGVQDLDDTIARLVAYESAGADVLYAPGLASAEQIQAVLEAVTKPVNVLFVFMPDKPLSEYIELGVRRISVGGALANHAIGATLGAVDQMLEAGDFSWAMNAAPAKVINQLLA